MHVAVCQHVPFEPPAGVAHWTLARGHRLTVSRLDRGDPLPPPDDADLFVILGGPMSTTDEDEYGWLPAERRLIDRALAAGNAVLGICLGAQQLAAALGATVEPHDHREIGWYPVSASDAAAGTVFDTLPETYPAFHWHGDRFSIPDEAVHTATSSACRNQAFVARGGRAVGLQFHLEVLPDTVERLVRTAGLPDGPWVQDCERVLAGDAPYDETRDALYALLDEVVTRVE